MEITKRKTMTGSRYLSFVLDEEEYCIDILKIKEIMGMTDITKIPQTPNFIKGVINLRGQIIPIIDLRIKFDLKSRDYTERTCIIVVEIPFEDQITLMGLIVDKIQEVINIPVEKISNVPYINTKIKSEYIEGIAEAEESIKIILNITKVLTQEEFILINKLEDKNIKADKKPVKDVKEKGGK